MILERKLMPLEREMENLNRLASSLNIVTISKVKGSISQDALKSALAIAQKRHPQLRSYIDGLGNELAFRASQNPPLPLEILEGQDSDAWKTVVLHELNQAIESHQSLFRVRFVDQKDDRAYLITTLHHAIADGISSVMLHAEILSYCQRTQVTQANLSPITSLPVLPPVETLCPRRYQGYRGKIKGIAWLLKVLAKQILLRPQVLAFEDLAPVEKRTCNVIFKRLEPDFTQTLLDHCRSENTTIQGTLCAAMLLAVADEIRAEKSRQIAIACRSYIDLRRRLSPAIANERLGSCASGVVTFHAISDRTDFWDLAREVNRKVKKGLNSGEAFNVITMITQVSRALRANTDKAPLAVEVTNLGKVDMPVNYDSLELEEISFMPAQGIFGGVFFAAVTTLNGRMMLNFLFSEPALSRHTVEALIDRTMSYLMSGPQQYKPKTDASDSDEQLAQKPLQPPPQLSRL